MVRSPRCNCPHATELFMLLGKRWSIFIMRSIDEGAYTFTDIRKNIGDANTKILTDRLAELVSVGIIEKSS
jgi:DNA-binding HxlR family transcriptional regulator